MCLRGFAQFYANTSGQMECAFDRTGGMVMEKLWGNNSGVKFTQNARITRKLH
jgi:hypothetical protein